MSETIEIGEALTLHDETGLKVIDVGLRATFYFRNGHTIERRRGVAACFNEFFEMAGDEISTKTRAGNSAGMPATPSIRQVP